MLSKDRIHELLQGFISEETMSEELLAALESYLALLCRWNVKVNLTAVRDPEAMVRRHFGESLFAAQKILAAGEPASVMDIGSGPGFPGIPVKLLIPAAQTTLIEAKAKKATFLREVIRALHLTGIAVQEGRAESTAAQAEVVTLRAVELFETIAPVARGHVKQGGRLVLLIGSAQVTRASEILGKEPEKVDEIPESAARVVAQWTF